MKVRKLCNLEQPSDKPIRIMRAPLNNCLDESSFDVRRRGQSSSPNSGRSKNRRQEDLHAFMQINNDFVDFQFGLSDNSRAVLARHMSCMTVTTAVLQPGFVISGLVKIGDHATGDSCCSFCTR